MIDLVAGCFPADSVIRPTFGIVDALDREGQYDIAIYGNGTLRAAVIVEAGQDIQRTHDLLVAGVMRVVLADIKLEGVAFTNEVKCRTDAVTVASDTTVHSATVENAQGEVVR